MKNKSGFSSIEIIISLSILVIVLSYVLIYVDSFKSFSKPRMISNDDIINKNYILNNNFCLFETGSKFNYLGEILLPNTFASNTKVTSLESTIGNTFIMTLNSNKVPDEDVVIFNMSIDNNNFEILATSSTGPGMNSVSVYKDNYYVTNQSSSNQLQIMDNSLKIIKQFTFDFLKQAYSMPKKITADKDYVYIGTEKNAISGELIRYDVRSGTSSYYEIDGQVNDMRIIPPYAFVATANDVELQIIDMENDTKLEYNADKTLGNGKSLIIIGQNVILGRTKSSNELHLLRLETNASTSSMLNLLDTHNISGTVEKLYSNSNNLDVFMGINNSNSKKVVIYAINGDKIIEKNYINLSEIVGVSHCNNNKLYLVIDGEFNKKIKIYEIQ